MRKIIRRRTTNSVPTQSVAGNVKDPEAFSITPGLVRRDKPYLSVVPTWLETYKTDLKSMKAENSKVNLHPLEIEHFQKAINKYMTHLTKQINLNDARNKARNGASAVGEQSISLAASFFNYHQYIQLIQRQLHSWKQTHPSPTYGQLFKFIITLNPRHSAANIGRRATVHLSL